MEFSQNLCLAHIQVLTRITISKGDKYPRAYISCHRGNESLILHRIFTKVAFCTSTTLNEHFCQVTSESDRNCRRRGPDKHF